MTRVEQHMPAVRGMWSRLKNKYPVNCRDDMLEDGYLGLVQADRSFDPDKNVSFLSHARHRVMGAMLDGIRRETRSRRGRLRHFVSLNLPSCKGDWEVLDELESNLPSPDRLVEQREARSMVVSALHALEAREQSVIIMRLYEGLTTAEAGKVLGVSGSMVSHIYREAVRKMRIALKIEKFNLCRRLHERAS